jgi:hypothetical protein
MGTEERLAELNKSYTFEAGAKILHEKLGIGEIGARVECGYPTNSAFLVNAIAAIAHLITGLKMNDPDIRTYLSKNSDLDKQSIDQAALYLNKLRD